MEFVKTEFYKILGVKQHAEFEKKLREMLFDKKQREEFYRKLLAIDNDVSVDTFRQYFEEYAAERKSNMQDYTPDSVAKILATITRSNVVDYSKSGYSGYDPTAGTGSLLIQKWWDDMQAETIFTYAPHRYLYLAEEMADNAIPYLLHNLAIRGMNACVVHGDTLERTVKQVYFVQNSDDDFLHFSDINVMPHTQDVAEWFDIRAWEEEAINHIESGYVATNPAFPMLRRKLEVEITDDFFELEIPWKNCPRLRDVAIVERAKKGKIYPTGSCVIQMSATKGQTGLLKSNGEVGSQYAVIEWVIPISPYFAFLVLKKTVPRWFARVQEGLNVKLEDIQNMPFMNFDWEVKRTAVPLGQLTLF